MQHTKEDKWNTSNKRLKHNCENALKHSKTIANTCNIQMIHLQHTYETPETLETYACNMQHPDLLLQHPDKTLATYVWNRWNIWNILLKHTCIVTTTCATSRSTFATSIYYTCTIPLKHLKHILSTWSFSVASTCCLNEWRPVDAELDAVKWRRGRGMPMGRRLRGPRERLCRHWRAATGLPATRRVGAVPRGGGDSAELPPR
jgi:hypothetical protein